MSASNSPSPSPAAKPAKLAAVKGMNDIMPPESSRWEWLEDQVRRLMAQFAYRNMRTPILEHTALFVRGIGEVTDIVEKEMYSFQDRSDKYGDNDHLSLRPENTAGVVRAAIEHNMLYDGPKRLWYTGPMFRREKPQRGRFRQFHQIGAEALGFAGPDVDAELILLADALWKSIGLTDVRLELNSLGQPAERARHREQLIAHFERHADLLDEDGKRRLHSNPLRILDTKNPAMKPVVESAPQLMDFLGEESLAHFNGLRAILDANGISYTINPRLVRGLDYYNLTVFEFITDRLGSQGTVCAGGRYDGLVEQMGGKPTTGVGFAMGIERLILLLETLGQVPESISRQVDVYLCAFGEQAELAALRLSEGLRDRLPGLRLQVNAGGGSFKSQFKKADKSGALYALIMGDDELAARQVGFKPLRGQGEQQNIAWDALAGHLDAALAQA